jgi:hypothetical protein
LPSLTAGPLVKRATFRLAIAVRLSEPFRVKSGSRTEYQKKQIQPLATGSSSRKPLQNRRFMVHQRRLITRRFLARPLLGPNSVAGTHDAGHLLRRCRSARRRSADAVMEAIVSQTTAGIGKEPRWPSRVHCWITPTPVTAPAWPFCCATGSAAVLKVGRPARDSGALPHGEDPTVRAGAVPHRPLRERGAPPRGLAAGSGESHWWEPATAGGTCLPATRSSLLTRSSAGGV